MKSIFMMLLLPFMLTSAFADSAAVEGAIDSVQAATSMDPNSLLGSVMIVISNFGGVGWALKAACIILLVLAFVKSSFMQPLWQKMGKFQAIAAPVLSILLGLFAALGNGQPVSFAAILAFLSTGVGAIGLHELLDMVKAIPGLGSIYVGIIDTIESALGGGSPPISK